MDEPPDVATLVAALTTEHESARKYAVFKLQVLLSDPSFAGAFIQGDGLLPLRQAVLDTTGNTQAYALGSLDALLELDMGWDIVDSAVIEKAVALAVAHPLVNLVRNALTLLVLIVSRPLTSTTTRDKMDTFGFRVIKPALDNHPTFLASLIQRLNASDHGLCANALQLVNALMRDAIVYGGGMEWPKVIRDLQDLGVISGVGMLMRGEAASVASSPLAAAILEFQLLTKVLLRKWREVKFNVALPEHKRALKTIHLLSKPLPYYPGGSEAGNGHHVRDRSDGKSSRRHHPEKWRRLGFETESPAWEFEETGYLGLMDLVDYVKRHEDAYQKILMEQSAQPREQRCPLARASLSVTLILYEHFELDAAPDLGTPEHQRGISHDQTKSHTSVDRLFRPLLLQWGRLHTGALNAFMRIWKAAGAEQEDFFKIEEVIRIVVEHIVGAADRRTEVGRIEEQLRTVSLETARRWQMEGLDEVYEDAWGPHLVAVREQLRHESLTFMKEQRVRCLLQGSWFPTAAALAGANTLRDPPEKASRFVRLSHNRRWLHYRDYSSRGTDDPALDELSERLDLNCVTSVDSNVSAQQPGAKAPPQPLVTNSVTANDSTETLKDTLRDRTSQGTNTKITIFGMPWTHQKHTKHIHDSSQEQVLLELYPSSTSSASEWLDGLLMLLNQRPITQDTTRLVELMEDWGVRLRLLNLRWEDVDWEALERTVKGAKVEEREVPSREGLDDEGGFWYAMPEEK